jgi:hypothetical protein
MDDAVLSCFTLLTEPERVLGPSNARPGSTDQTVRVVNICCGEPQRDLLTEWDRICGARSSWAQVHRRIAEDAELMAQLGIESFYLDVLDSQYRPAGPEPDTAAIAEGILDVVEVDEDSTVWMPWARYPSGSATHADHLLSRAASELLVSQSGARGRYFADLPYLSGEALLDRSVSDAEPTVITVAAKRAKLGICRAYRTQWRYLKTSWKRVKDERYVDATPKER